MQLGAENGIVGCVAYGEVLLLHGLLALLEIYPHAGSPANPALRGPCTHYVSTTVQCLVQCHPFAMLADLYSCPAASYYTAFFSVAFVVYFLRKKGESSLQAETPAMSCVQIWGMYCNAPADQQPCNLRQVTSHCRRPSTPAMAAWLRCVCAVHSQPGSQGLLPTEPIIDVGVDPATPHA